MHLKQSFRFILFLLLVLWAITGPELLCWADAQWLKCFVACHSLVFIYLFIVELVCGMAPAKKVALESFFNRFFSNVCCIGVFIVS
jgi:hypothetical protein